MPETIEAVPPRVEQRRLKKKKRHPKLITSHLQLYDELKPRGLKGLIMGTAVYLCVEYDIVKKLDALCFGNLDGGSGTAQEVKQTIEGLGCVVSGDMAVRISLDEAFFMAYGLGILTVYGHVEGAVQKLDTDVGQAAITMVYAIIISCIYICMCIYVYIYICIRPGLVMIT